MPNFGFFADQKKLSSPLSGTVKGGEINQPVTDVDAELRS